MHALKQINAVLALDVADIIQALCLTRFMDYAGYDDQALRS